MPNDYDPLVSVVMVISNVEKFLAQAIESILNQTFSDFEFIIVDFGSTDTSKDIVSAYAAADNRVVFSEVPTCSYIEAKIAACSLARSRYIAIQDADDVSLPGRLKMEVDFLEKHPQIGFLGGAVQWIDAHGSFLETAEDYPIDDCELRLALKERNPFWHPTVLLRGQAYRSVGGYRRAFAQSDDYDLWLRISEHYQCANLAEKVLHYRIHPQQLSLRRKKDQILCAMAAKASASLRREGKPDPLDLTSEITSEILDEMGVSKEEQRISIVKGYSYWVQRLFSAGEYAAVFEAAAEVIRECEGKSDVAQYISEVQVLSARACWKQGKIMRCLLSIARAVRADSRILRGLMRRLLGHVELS